MSTGTPKGELTADATRRLAKAASRLGAVLYDLDADARVAVLNADTTWRGRTADLIGDATEVAARLWERWAALRDVADQAVAAVDAGHEDRAAALLDAPITLPDGTTRGPFDLADSLAADARRVTDVATQIDEALAAAAALVAEARARLAELEEQAGSYGVADTAAMIAARAAVHHLADQAQVDPAADGLGRDVARELDTADQVISTAADRAKGLPDRLDRAAAQVGELRTLIHDGAAALDLARSKVVVTGGLLQPLDPAIADAEPMGLAPWLERIRAAADRGDVRAAAAGLARWEAVAAVHLDHARTITGANAAPLYRRDELRGLLGALRAKAGAGGLAEDATTARLHDVARDLLYVAPCPLLQAEQAVEAYREHVTGSGGTMTTTTTTTADTDASGDATG